MSALLLVMSIAGLLAWAAVVVADWDSPPRPGRAPPIAPSRWRGHP